MNHFLMMELQKKKKKDYCCITTVRFKIGNMSHSQKNVFPMTYY